MRNRWLLYCALIGAVVFALPVTLFLDWCFVAPLFNLAPREEAQDLLTCLPFVVMFNVPLLFLFWLIWWLIPGQRLFDPAWRGVVRNTPRGPRVRLQPMGRMFAVWPVLLFTSVFASLTATQIVNPYPESIRPPVIENQALAMFMAGLVWLLGGCAAAVVARWERAVGVVQDDAKAGTLNWRSLGCRYERAVVRHLVTQVSVRNGRSFNGMPDPTSWRVVLHWTNTEGDGMADTIVEYQNPADAEALAGWLRERLGLGEEPHPPSPSP